MLRRIQVLVNVRQQNSVYVCACVHFCAHMRLNLLSIYVNVKNFEQKLERKMKHGYYAKNAIPVVMSHVIMEQKGANVCQNCYTMGTFLKLLVFCFLFVCF